MPANTENHVVVRVNQAESKQLIFPQMFVSKKQLSAEVQYIIPTNHASRIVTHARYINRACLRKLIL